MQCNYSYVRYATAAYGLAAIQSSELLNVNGHPISYGGLGRASEKKRKRKMAKFLGIEEDDIVDLSKPGGDIDINPYVLAVDRRKSAIVLTFRGTNAVSGAKVDLAFYTAPFCDGLAHAGIAQRTEEIWELLQDQVVQLLKDNPGFELIITGHSLGAGVAALLTLKLKHERILANIDPELSVRCFAYACPPVYLSGAESELSTAEAMKSIYAFIYRNDVVPFCSVDSLRRISETINTVNEMTNPVEGFLMAIGRRDVPPEIIEKMNEIEDSELPYVPGSEKLVIPTPYIMWLRPDAGDKKDENGQLVFNTMFCRTCTTDGKTGTNDLTLMLADVDMIRDHMNPQYERALNSIYKQLMKEEKGDEHCYIFPPSTD